MYLTLHVLADGPFDFFSGNRAALSIQRARL
jgi:hypothetical protein